MSNAVIRALVSLLLAVTSFTTLSSELIVKLTVSPQEFLDEHPEVKELQPIAKDLNLYLAVSHERAVLDVNQKSGTMDGAKYTMANDIVTKRSQPNDPKFRNQWAFGRSGSKGSINPQDAWAISTGGVNILGQEVVAAVIDGGVDVNHPDLAGNMWVNQAEIPNNNIDDDGNGYVDDIHGWNAKSGNNYIPADNHGTHVAGIIGAVGNNGTGVTGVNWNTKIMAINGASTNTAQVLRAYNYVLKQKKLWIETKGAKGANVVVTNSSFGIDGANCNSSRYQAWNDMYNEMGKYGIISAVATANRKYDIDVKGDVPTGCTSPYIISVTNTDDRDRLYSSFWGGGAAWGKKGVDIGAPGTEIYSTLPGRATGPNTGTSMATPYIAGAVALMHSSASVDFAVNFDEDPAKYALDLKKIILDTAKQLSSLKNKTVTGGRLDLGKAVTEINQY
jgi:subtilisin family serine protease